MTDMTSKHVHGSGIYTLVAMGIVISVAIVLSVVALIRGNQDKDG
jgi:hypothetical protein